MQQGGWHGEKGEQRNEFFPRRLKSCGRFKILLIWRDGMGGQEAELGGEREGQG